MPKIFNSITDSTLTLETYLICTVCAFLCGIIATLACSYRAKRSKSFITSLIILAPIVETVIIMVNGSIGTGIAVAGAFSLVRFRSAPGKANEISFIFLVMTSGLACAAGYVAIAVMFTIIVSIAIIIISHIPMHFEKEMDLKITIPESLNYSDAFNDIFNTYSKKYQLINVKTSNMGSLYKLHYKIELKDINLSKDFIDSIRCRNGNLEISLTENAEDGTEL